MYVALNPQTKQTRTRALARQISSKLRRRPTSRTTASSSPSTTCRTKPMTPTSISREAIDHCDRRLNGSMPATGSRLPFHSTHAAATMAGEQSTGTFLRVPGETDELRERYAARVEHITELGTVERLRCPAPACPKEPAATSRDAPPKSRSRGRSRTWAHRSPTCSRLSQAISPSSSSSPD